MLLPEDEEEEEEEDEEDEEDEEAPEEEDEDEAPEDEEEEEEDEAPEDEPPPCLDRHPFHQWRCHAVVDRPLASASGDWPSSALASGLSSSAEGESGLATLHAVTTPKERRKKTVFAFFEFRIPKFLVGSSVTDRGTERPMATRHAWVEATSTRSSEGHPDRRLLTHAHSA